jgi:hypothetical protein
MRLPGARHDCGPLLELGWVSRQLRLSQPVTEGIETIPVASIIGTAGRGRDFDGCWHAAERHLSVREHSCARAHHGRARQSATLLMHRHQLAAWGGECDAPECVPDQVACDVVFSSVDGSRGSVAVCRRIRRHSCPLAPPRTRTNRRDMDGDRTPNPW